MGFKRPKWLAEEPPAGAHVIVEYDDGSTDPERWFFEAKSGRGGVRGAGANRARAGRVYSAFLRPNHSESGKT